jgi:hypothetical protein
VWYTKPSRVQSQSYVTCVHRQLACSLAYEKTGIM